MKSGLIPIYLRRLKTVGQRLSAQLGSKVDVNPLPTFRVKRAKGNLFLIKNSKTARLLWGQNLMQPMETGDGNEIALDWYFSFYFFLLKELLTIFDSTNPREKQRIVGKIMEGLDYLSTISPPLIGGILSQYAKKTLTLAAGNIDWFETRDIMVALFADLARASLGSKSDDIFSQVDTFLGQQKGRNPLKNYEYATLSFLRGNFVRPDRIISGKLISDRYRAALLLVAAAPSMDGVESKMTAKALQILQGCVILPKGQKTQETWENLRAALFENWDIAQSLMGL